MQRLPHGVTRDYEFAKRWILDPKAIDPKTRMVVPDVTPEQVDAVRMFVWKTSMDAGGAAQEEKPVTAQAQ